MNDTQTVRSVVERYLSHVVANNKFCAEALADRRRLFKVFVERLGDRAVEACCADDLAEMIDNNPLWKATNTKRAKAHQINAVFNWAKKVGRIERNPFAGVSYEEGPPRKPTDDADLSVLMQWACLPVRRMLFFARETACRPCELRRVLWTEVDWGRAAIVHWKHKTIKKTKKPRVIPLTEPALKLLRDMKAEMERRGRVCAGEIFRNTQGRPWKKQALVLHWQRLRERAMVPQAATLHGVRHRSATESIRAGGNLKLISLGLGHASVTTTERYYIQLTDAIDDIRREMAKGKPPM